MPNVSFRAPELFQLLYFYNEDVLQHMTIMSMSFIGIPGIPEVAYKRLYNNLNFHV